MGAFCIMSSAHDILFSMDKIVWIDVETTGLSPFTSDDTLLQIACFVTDNDLNLLDDEGYEAVVKYDKASAEAAYAQANDFVKNMHSETGLWDRLTTDGKTLDVIDQEVTEYIRRFQPEPSSAWFGGNSIKLDRDFTSVFLPNLYSHIHYRSLDVTSFAGVARAWYGFEFEKKKTHDARDDIMESIEELRAYRKTIFVTQDEFRARTSN
jgi:oligoribonuclease